MRFLILAVFAVLLILASVYADNGLCLKNCRADEHAFRIIRNFEGYSPFIYSDAAGIPTIGFGHAIKAGEEFDEPLMGEEAQALLEQDVSGTEAAINRMVNTPLRQNQFDALTSFAYNLGTGTLARSTLLRLVNIARHEEVPDQFLRYDKARVRGVARVLPGLFNRRQSEARLYGDTP